MTEMLQGGQVFAERYRIERFLARGGFGAVYVAEQIETELRVALKVLWPHILGSEDAVQKFKLEAKIAGRVGSDHIVRVFDAGFDAATGMPFLVMELLTGAALEDLVHERGPLSPQPLVEYFRQVASALDRAHGYVDRDGQRRAIVHRDLKPENLFLATRESGGPIIKVLDFGIAKVLSESTSVSRDIKGTPLYMAIEQASGGKITPQTDIWALGLVAFFLLTGRTYWKSANAEEASLTQLFGEVLSLPLDPPSGRARFLGSPVIPSAAFDAWFSKCVNRDPEARYRTAGECAEALAIALLGDAVRREGPVSAFDATTVASAEMTDAVMRASGSVAAQSGAGDRPGSTAAAVSLGNTGAAPKPARRSTPVIVALASVSTVVALGAAFAFRSPPPTEVGSASSSSTPHPASNGVVPMEPRNSAPPVATPSVPSATASATMVGTTRGAPGITVAPLVKPARAPATAASHAERVELNPQPFAPQKPPANVYDDR